MGEPTATVSNTALNVVYRDYENPFSISVPGVSQEKIRVNVAGGASVSKKGNSWVIKVTDAKTKEITISVQAEMEGKMQTMGSATYRVKGLPKPSAYLKVGEKQYNEKDVPRSMLLSANAEIFAGYGPDDLLSLPFKVKSFQIRAGSGGLIPSKSNKFTKEQSAKLGKLAKGAIISIEDVRAVGPAGNEIRLSPIVLIMN